MEDILQFQGEFRWLSNFEPCPVSYLGVTYLSVEHAYMSAKNDSQEWKDFCHMETSPGKVKRASNAVVLVDNWEVKKIEVMGEMLLQKFTSEPFKSKLAATGDVYIQEGNFHNDAFWGFDLKKGTGKNLLGKMIMMLRDFNENNCGRLSPFDSSTNARIVYDCEI